MFRIAIYDKNEKNRMMIGSCVERFLNRNHYKGIIDYYGNERLLEESSKRSYAVVFVHGRKEVFSGVQFCEKLLEADPYVKIVAVIDGLEEKWIDGKTGIYMYLLWPLNNSSVETMLTRVYKEYQKKIRPYLFLRKQGELRKLYLEDILYVELYERRLKIWICGKYMEVNAKISDIEKVLDRRFFRIHESYIVNIDFIVEVKKNRNSYDVKIINGKKLPMSRLRKGEFMCLFSERIGRDKSGTFL